MMLSKFNCDMYLRLTNPTDEDEDALSIYEYGVFFADDQEFAHVLFYAILSLHHILC
jgi:hypothetical protein